MCILFWGSSYPWHPNRILENYHNFCMLHIRTLLVLFRELRGQSRQWLTLKSIPIQSDVKYMPQTRDIVPGRARSFTQLSSGIRCHDFGSYIWHLQFVFFNPFFQYEFFFEFWYLILFLEVRIYMVVVCCSFHDSVMTKPRLERFWIRCYLKIWALRRNCLFRLLTTFFVSPILPHPRVRVVLIPQKIL